ncbi:MAG TPA: glycosyltransferase family 2 protein [Virgibacillus sp.]|nr:glycosyltransferase family 2 protein [Virgibacillus sp.]HLR67009.1 glycosyltransferase family 2 protein [Virgibacillus sp.]
MNLKNFLSIDHIPNNKTPVNDSIIQLKNGLFSKKLVALEGTVIYDELITLGLNTDMQDAAFLILSEPMESTLSAVELDEFVHKYRMKIEEAQKNGVPIIHLISNTKWFSLFEDILVNEIIHIFISKADFDDITFDSVVDKVTIVDDYIMPSSLHYYSNEVNNSIIVDLTMADTKKNGYILDFDKLLQRAMSFDKVLLLVREDTFIPDFLNDKIQVLKDMNSEVIHSYSNVFVYTNKPYSHEVVSKVLYYAANSKVVFTNYNYSLNNVIPSVKLNLNKKDYEFSPLEDVDAFNIINENRNNVMYNLTLLNVLEKIHLTIFSKPLINKCVLNFDYEIPTTNNFFELSVNEATDFDISIKSSRYDIEQLLFFPILFMGKKGVEFHDSYIAPIHGKTDFKIFRNYRHPQRQNTKKKLSMIVPIHNNGKYLKYKCYLSMKYLTCFNDLEIIFVDDGSTDFETLRIIKDILSENQEIVYKRFEVGSGSASRPRNVGMEMATTDFITFLDPDNEAISDGFSILLEKMLEDSSLDMIVGNIVREDNIKRNEINYYDKVIKVNKGEIIDDTRNVLVETNLTVQSIQALVVKRNILLDNNLKMVEGAAGQDTLFFQELILKCSKVRIINHMIHSYYAYVEGSVTNTVTHKFFEKFYKVELQRIKFLERENLIDVYMRLKFNFYFKNWYLKKYNEMKDESEKEAAKIYLDKIIKLYDVYQDYFEEINY